MTAPEEQPAKELATETEKADIAPEPGKCLAPCLLLLIYNGKHCAWMTKSLSEIQQGVVCSLEMCQRRGGAGCAVL